MNTAVPIASPVRTPEVGSHAARGLAGLARRIRASVAAWSPAARRPLTRDELAERHERRLEAERLRDETRRAVYLTHTF